MKYNKSFRTAYFLDCAIRRCTQKGSQNEKIDVEAENKVNIRRMKYQNGESV